MSDEENQGSATSEAAKTAKPKPEVVKVTMTDGRVVEFVGKRLLDKNYTTEGDSVTATFDFRNGETRKVKVDLGDPILFKFAGHGIVQKIGDETAGVKNEDGSPDVDSMVVAVDSIISRLAGTGSVEDRWYAERAAGDGFSGASVVIKAIMEASGKDVAFVKGFLDKKLAAGKESGLTRQKLYASFRAPGTKTAPIIERLEKEKKAPAPAVNADDALAEMTAG